MNNKMNTKEKLIETASKLFEIKGYYATGLNEILAESEAPKGSLYYHFPKGKEQLALESINSEGKKIKSKVQSVLESIEDPVDAIVANIENIAIIIENEHKVKDMSISLLALETHSTSDVLREACDEIFTSLENVYAKKLIKAGINEEDAYKLGSTIAVMIEGGITYSLVKKNGKPLRLIAEQISKLINIYIK